MLAEIFMGNRRGDLWISLSEGTAHIVGHTLILDYDAQGVTAASCLKAEYTNDPRYHPSMNVYGVSPVV